MAETPDKRLQAYLEEWRRIPERLVTQPWDEALEELDSAAQSLAGLVKDHAGLVRRAG